MDGVWANLFWSIWSILKGAMPDGTTTGVKGGPPVSGRASCRRAKRRPLTALRRLAVLLPRRSARLGSGVTSEGGERFR